MLGLPVLWLISHLVIWSSMIVFIGSNSFQHISLSIWVLLVLFMLLLWSLFSYSPVVRNRRFWSISHFEYYPAFGLDPEFGVLSIIFRIYLDAFSRVPSHVGVFCILCAFSLFYGLDFAHHVGGCLHHITEGLREVGVKTLITYRVTLWSSCATF